MTTTATAAAPLLLLTVDRLPAWLLPPWGCTWVSMPALTSLAARGVVFDRLLATSDAPAETLAAIAGHPAPDGHGSRTLLEAASAAGLAPALITDDAEVAAWAAGGVTVIDVPIQPTATVATDASSTNLARLFAAAAGCLAAGSHRFVWCHVTSLGEVWDAPDEYREAYLDPDDPPPPAGATVPDQQVDAAIDPDLVVGMRHVFAGQLTLLDECLGQLLEVMPAANDWAVLVAGVRGLGLGLHDRLGPGPMAPFSELIHLPAVLVAPEGRMAAQRYGGLVTPADLGATLGELIGRPAPADDDPRQGRSLATLFHDWSWRARDRVISATATGVAVATPAWLLIAAPPPTDHATAGIPPRLFAKPDDFFERSDVADRCPGVTDELAALAALAIRDPRDAWTQPLSAAAVEGV